MARRLRYTPPKTRRGEPGGQEGWGGKGKNPRRHATAVDDGQGTREAHADNAAERRAISLDTERVRGVLIAPDSGSARVARSRALDR